MVKKALGSDYDVATHFTPRYAPWDQRVCAVPDGDLFKQIRQGKASVETGQIAQFETDGISLQDGRFLHADIVVVATGLHLNVLADVAIHVDGNPFVAGRQLCVQVVQIHGQTRLPERLPTTRPHANHASVFGFHLGLCATRQCHAA